MSEYSTVSLEYGNHSRVSHAKKKQWTCLKTSHMRTRSLKYPSWIYYSSPITTLCVTLYVSMEFPWRTLYLHVVYIISPVCQNSKPASSMYPFFSIWPIRRVLNARTNFQQRQIGNQKIQRIHNFTCKSTRDDADTNIDYKSASFPPRLEPFFLLFKSDYFASAATIKDRDPASGDLASEMPGFRRQLSVFIINVICNTSHPHTTVNSILRLLCPYNSG